MNARLVSAWALGLALLAAPGPALGDDPRPTDPACRRVASLTARMADPSRRAEALAQVAKAQALAGDEAASARLFAAAVAMVKGLPLPSNHHIPHTVARIGNVQKEAGDLPGAIASYRIAFERENEVPRGSDNLYPGYLILSQYQAEAGDMEGARASSAMGLGCSEKYKSPSAETRPVELLAALRDFDGAFRALDEHRPTPGPAVDPDYTAGALDAIARAAAKCTPEVGLPVLRRALEVAATIRAPGYIVGPEIDIGGAAARFGDFDLAARSIRAFRDPIPAPGHLFYIGYDRPSALLGLAVALAKAGRPDEAHARIAEAIALARAEPPRHEGLLDLGSSVRCTWAAIGDDAKALGDFDGAGPKPYELSTIAFVQERNGHLAAATKTRLRSLAEAEDRLRALRAGRPAPAGAPIWQDGKMVDDPTPQQRMLGALLEVAGAKAELGDESGALAIALPVADHRARLGALLRLTRAQAYTGAIAAAADWIGRLDDREGADYCIETLAQGLAERYETPSNRPRSGPEPAQRPGLPPDRGGAGRSTGAVGGGGGAGAVGGGAAAGADAGADGRGGAPVSR